MFTNRISRYFESDRAIRPVVAQAVAFMACPMTLMPGGWAHSLYQAAWEQAKVEVRHAARSN